ncbi:acyl-CoA dehydrogenase family protein [Mycobacterium marinum]|uniref:acyl-CoA dehydrogenase family protein n=1 Tax=Mycobacterium marinum TaxID=1781 RepID=UPI0035613896
MDVGLTSEQLELRHNARDILRAACPPDAARQAMTDPQCWRAPWKTLVDLGWTELAASDCRDDFGSVERALVLEESGRAIAPIPLLSSIGMAAGVLRGCGPAAKDVLSEIAAGVVATLAVQSPGHRLARPPMVLQHGRLRGHAVAVPNLTRAELIVTLAATADGPVAALLRRGDGVTTRTMQSSDPAQPLADLEVDAIPALIAPVASIESVLTAPLLAVSADLVGVADAVLQHAVEHAKSRHQFGAPIGGFQGIKHALADNYVSVERARSLTYAAASHPAPDWTAAALAKAVAADAAVRCATTAVQVYGAIAQTWEHHIHLYVRHAWQGAAQLGDSRALYHEVGRRFAGGPQ